MNTATAAVTEGRRLPRRRVPPYGSKLLDLHMHTDGREVASLRIAHLWQECGGTWTSLYAVVSDGRLFGTFLLMVESGTRTFPEVLLRFPGAGTAVHLGERLRDDEVLGSEFTYDDLRLLRSDTEVTFRTVKGVENRIDMTADTEGVVGEARWAVVGVREPWRVRTVDGITHAGGYAFETRLRSLRPGTAMSSTMDLLDVSLDIPAVKVPGKSIADDPDATSMVFDAVRHSGLRQASEGEE